MPFLQHDDSYVWHVVIDTMVGECGAYSAETEMLSKQSFFESLHISQMIKEMYLA